MSTTRAVSRILVLSALAVLVLLGCGTEGTTTQTVSGGNVTIKCLQPSRVGDHIRLADGREGVLTSESIRRVGPRTLEIRQTVRPLFSTTVVQPTPVIVNNPQPLVGEPRAASGDTTDDADSDTTNVANPAPVVVNTVFNGPFCTETETAPVEAAQGRKG